MVHSVSIKQLLFNMAQHDASDLHIKVGLPPTFRINGRLKPLGLPPLNAEDTERLLMEIIPEQLRARFIENGDIDFSTFLDTKTIPVKPKPLDVEKHSNGDHPDAEAKREPDLCHLLNRFRCNVYRAGGGMHGAIRRINPDIPTFDSLKLPSIYEKIADETGEGLVLVVGVTGSGKSTTLACMLERVNQTRSENIITIEDPVEYHFQPKKSIISQREIGLDVPSYHEALRYVVRQDPDVIFIGEMRDHETVMAAIQAAETGHLVFGSMHTADTMQAFSRIIEFFPQSEREFVRSALSNSIQAVCAQRLVPANKDSTGGAGVVPATEVLLANPSVREKIREGEDADLPAIIYSSKSDGMRSFTQSFAELVEKDWITTATAMEYAPNRDALSSVLKGVEVKASSMTGRIKAGARH